MPSKKQIEEINKRAREVAAENIEREPNGRKSRRTGKPVGGSRPGAGRPPGIIEDKPRVENPRKRYVPIMLTEAEWQEIDAAARKAKLTRSELIRKRLGMPDWASRP